MGIIKVTDREGKVSDLKADIGSTIISAVEEGILEKGGGHKMAGGFTINKDKIEKFKNFVTKKFEKMNIDMKKQKNLYI